MTLEKRISVNSADDIPAFESEAEEHEFWTRHEIGPGLLSAATSPNDEPALPPKREPKASRTTSLRLDSDLERRLKHVAKLKGIPYQTLLKSFVQERLYEEEKRLKVI